MSQWPLLDPGKKSPSWHLVRCALAVLSVCLPAAAPRQTIAAAALPPGEVRLFGNQTYVNLSVRESYTFHGKNIRLESIAGASAVVSIDGTAVKLQMARRILSTVAAGVRLSLCDTRDMVEYTTEQHEGTRRSLTKDALLCLSDPDKPLLDPNRFTFPVDRTNGFNWTMAENSHTYAFLSEVRQHEGTDISIADGKVNPVHALVAIEDATVIWVHPHDREQLCLLLESSSTPGVYFVYQHLEATTVSLRAGDRVKRGQKLGFIWGDNDWGHLHFAVIGWGDPPSYEERYRNSIPAFPMLYELWHGDLEPRRKQWSWGLWTLARNRATVDNIKRLNAFDELLGYGWLLGDWCPAAKVEPTEGNDQYSSALLRKHLFDGTISEAVNPEDYYDFEIAVPNGRYAVNLLLGDANQRTSQRVIVEAAPFGSYDLEPNQLTWTRERRVQVTDGRLTIRLYLRDDTTYAALSEILFHYMNSRN
jgi:murein DD-endopeptidase MepM/ murein hydrolase activator NlpD